MGSRKPPLEVVLGVVVRGDGRFLVQPRSGDPAMEGLWELPGGKIARGEDPHSALVREIEEETGLAVRVEEEPLCALSHAYADRRVTLRVYWCEPLGEPCPPRWTRWVTPHEYRELPMPDANPPIVDAVERAGARPPWSRTRNDAGSAGARDAKIRPATRPRPAHRRR